MKRILLSLICAAAANAADPLPFWDRPVSSFTVERIPKWLLFSGEFRTRVEGRTGFGYQPDNNDAYALFRTRVNLEIAPAKWLDFFAQGQDSRAPGLDAGRPQATLRDPFDLRQAYIRLGAPNSLVRLTVGRQLLSYGAQRLIGPLDWTNTSRAWDAVKVEIGTSDLKVDLFASSVVVIDPTRGINHHRDGFNIHGAYGSMKKIVPKSTIEPYALWKSGGVSVWTGGVRFASLQPVQGFDYQAEFARQGGRVSTLVHTAQAGYGILGFLIAPSHWSPHVSGEYSYASGDPHTDAASHRTFDQLLPTNHLFYGVTDPLGWQNMRMARFGGDVKPRKQIRLFADYRWLWLDQASDALYDVTGKAAVKPKAGNTARAVGTELDLSATWAISRQWKLGAGIGHLFAGDFLKQNSKGSGQTFPYLTALYSF
jgi:hypothetical protein